MIAHRLADKLAIVVRGSTSPSDPAQLVQYDSQAESGIHVAGSLSDPTGVLTNLAANFNFGPAHVSGELTMSGDGFALTTRVAGRSAQVFRGAFDDLDDILLRGALHVWSETRTPIAAAYCFANHRPAEALALVMRIVESGQKKDRAWAYNLWGLLLVQDNKVDEAKAKFYASISDDSSSARASYRRAIDLTDQTQRSAIVDKLKQMDDGIPITRGDATSR